MLIFSILFIFHTTFCIMLIHKHKRTDASPARPIDIFKNMNLDYKVIFDIWSFLRR